MKVVRSIRTDKTIEAYQKFLRSGFTGCGMCREKNVKEFTYWRIIKARFPLDKIARTNHILMPITHHPINKLTLQEKKEFEVIKHTYLKEKYDAILEAMPRSQSIPTHHHVHLLIWRKD